MMNLIPPVGWFDLASKHDLETSIDALEARMDSKLDRLRADLMRSFATWLFASQAIVISTLGLLITLR